MEDIFVGRQPIYNRDLRVVAYELLYRSSRENLARFDDNDQATSEVLINSFMEIGLEGIVGRHPAFINLGRKFITGEHPLPLSHRHVVVEVLEDVSIDKAMLDGLKRLAAQGYLIALDDFEFEPERLPLLDIAHIVKLEVMGQDDDALAEKVALLRPYNVKLLAEKVETHEELARCQRLGFDYFQGYFFCRPNIVEGKSPKANRAVLMQLLAKLQEPELEVEEMERLLVQDVPLTYRLLRHVNSPFYGLRNKVESVRRALIVLGRNTVKNWASLILMTRIDDKPQELINMALVRARMCELSAAPEQERRRDVYFTVGLFSLLDAMLDRPLDELVEALPLEESLKSALLERSGPLGEVLNRVILYQAGEWDGLIAEGKSAMEQISRHYIDAILWANETLAHLSQPEESLA